MKLPSDCTTAELEPFAREWLRRLRAGRTPRAKLLKPCPKCCQPFGVAEMRKHLPRCPATVPRGTSAP